MFTHAHISLCAYDYTCVCTYTICVYVHYMCVCTYFSFRYRASKVIILGMEQDDSKFQTGVGVLNLKMQKWSPDLSGSHNHPR